MTCVMRRLCTLPRVLLLVVAAAIAFLIIAINRATRDDRWYMRPAPCSYPPERAADTLLALERTRDVLTRAGLTHFLCYGSLWGALRSGELLPSDRAADLCLLNEQLDTLDENYLYRFFRDAGLSLSYHPPTGVYHADLGMNDASVTLTVFELSSDAQWYQRVGMLSRLLPPQAKSRFPSRLAQAPLASIAVQGVVGDLPIPREDIEIQKYLYEDDWWKVVPPPGC